MFTLPFKSIVVASTNDYYVTYERATLFAESWGADLVNIGDAGHINVASGFGEWNEGLEILKWLDS
ncbi:alpha/beta hydrolase [Mucilaginibacter xinganensis]|uniref:Alpha/beta hydrolase n=1 Tax=Mucilaginibacter xinganensis TaxID=1234841 RepID=A0A223P2U9_9SPHI|nr:alpha/beta hydrolase [Mucilaginibacter xinganensis]